MNASANFADGGVSESTRMFHIASCASCNPGRRPTRGSGDGAVAGVLTLRLAGPAWEVVADGAVVTTAAGGVHAETVRDARIKERLNMFVPVKGFVLRK